MLRQRRSARVARLAVAEATAAPPSSLEDLRGLRVRELRRVLGAAGLDVAGRVDRESLLELLEPEGAVERVLAASAARAAQGESSRPQVAEVPLVMAGNCLMMDMTIGQTPTRFMVDTACPFTMVDHGFAQQIGAKLIPGGDPSAPRAILGKVSFGSLECGQAAAVPVQMPLPPGCHGVLAMDLLQNFEWDFDFPEKTIRVCPVPSSSGPSGAMRTDGLREVRLDRKQTMVAGRAVELLTTSMTMQKTGGASVPCVSVLHLASAVTACSDMVAKDMSVTADDFISVGKQIQGPGGGYQMTVQEAELSLSLGVGGAVQRDSAVCIGHPVLQNFAQAGASSILGLDVLSRSRLVFLPRENAMWLEP